MIWLGLGTCSLKLLPRCDANKNVTRWGKTWLADVSYTPVFSKSFI